MSGLGAFVSWTNNNLHVSVNVNNKTGNEQGFTGYVRIDKIVLQFPTAINEVGARKITFTLDSDETTGISRPVTRDVRFSTIEFLNPTLTNAFPIKLLVDFTATGPGGSQSYTNVLLNTVTPTRKDVGYVWATAHDATPSAITAAQGAFYASTAKLMAESGLTYLGPGNYLNHRLFGPTTSNGAIAQTALNVRDGITSSTMVVTGTHGAEARLWSSNAPVAGDQAQWHTVWSTSLHADSTSVGDTLYTVKGATDAKGASPDVHLALLYACETILGGNTKLKTAFLRSQTADAAIGAFPLLLYYETAPGTPASTHTSKLLNALDAGQALNLAIRDANRDAPLLTAGFPPYNTNPMLLQGDDFLTAKFVYLNSTEYPTVSNRMVWYIVKKGGTIQ
jgi:hypothetical protein